MDGFESAPNHSRMRPPILQKRVCHLLLGFDIIISFHKGISFAAISLSIPVRVSIFTCRPGCRGYTPDKGSIWRCYMCAH